MRPMGCGASSGKYLEAPPEGYLPRFSDDGPAEPRAAAPEAGPLSGTPGILRTAAAGLQIVSSTECLGGAL